MHHVLFPDIWLAPPRGLKAVEVWWQKAVRLRLRHHGLLLVAVVVNIAANAHHRNQESSVIEGLPSPPFNATILNVEAEGEQALSPSLPGGRL